MLAFSLGRAWVSPLAIYLSAFLDTASLDRRYRCVFGVRVQLRSRWIFSGDRGTQRSYRVEILISVRVRIFCQTGRLSEEIIVILHSSITLDIKHEFALLWKAYRSILFYSIPFLALCSMHTHTRARVYTAKRHSRRGRHKRSFILMRAFDNETRDTRTSVSLLYADGRQGNTTRRRIGRAGWERRSQGAGL